MFKAYPLMMLVVITITGKLSEANQEQMFKDLCIKMKSLWGNEIIPDTNLAKKFKRDLDVFVQERDYMVVQDKVAVAQVKVNQTKQIAQDNVTKMYENTKEIEDKLLPSSLDLVDEAKEGEQLANDIKQEEVKRRRSLWCYIIIFVLIIVGIVLAILLK